jgi:dolichol kinase
MTLWALFKFVMVPVGAQLYVLYTPQHFSLVFMLIWGSYMVTDTLSEVGGSLYGAQKIRVVGLGDVNRKSIAGTVTGFIGGLVLCVALVGANSPGGAWFGLAVTIAVSNSLLELWSPRGTDDFVMATANALICWAFGAWVL